MCLWNEPRNEPRTSEEPEVDQEALAHSYGPSELTDIPVSSGKKGNLMRSLTSSSSVGTKLLYKHPALALLECDRGLLLRGRSPLLFPVLT